MPYSFEYCPECKKEVKKLCKNSRPLKEALKKKVEQILESPHHFKPLKKPLQQQQRVHILNCFVLTYETEEEQKLVRLLKFLHHDKAY
jgi:mRNA-degrading endonuclease RelE of RelBE toxin-antitoxin system